MALEQADCGLVNSGVQHRLHTAVEQGHTLARLDRLAPFGCRQKGLGPVHGAWGWQGCGGHHVQHGAQGTGEQTAERPPQTPAKNGKAEQPRIGDKAHQQFAHGTLEERTFVVLLHIFAPVGDELGIFHAGRANGLARKAGQAAVQMFDRSGVWHAAFFVHVFHQENTATGAVVFLMLYGIGGAARQAHPAMHAVANNVFGQLHVRVRIQRGLGNMAEHWGVSYA
ncbi:hypothetical protein JK182_13265 [Acetobacter okinawensis]|nr:hypothetical protein [Acetobacter okinawensis]